MANWNDLKASVAEVIKTNANQEITGQILQNALSSIISNLGENATFAGIATPTTNPGTPDGPVFYLASQSGTYSNFGSVKLLEGCIGIFKNTSSNTWELSILELETYVKGKDGYADGLNMYDKSRNTPGMIIQTGNVFTTIESRYWAITDYIPVAYNRTYTLKNYADIIYNQDGNRFALFKDKSESSYITDGAPSSFASILSQHPEAKYARFSIRQVGPDITSIFFISQDSFFSDFEGIKKIAEDLDTNAYTKNEAIIEGVNMYNKNANTPKLIIKQGDSYLTQETNAYDVTDFILYDPERDFIYSGITTGNYTDKGCMAFFSERNDGAFISSIVIPSDSEESYGIVPKVSNAKYVKFTLRTLKVGDDNVDRNTFSYSCKPIDIEKINSLKVKDYNKLTIDAMGDSYTELGYDDNRGFMFFGCQLLGMDKSRINNYGIGGTLLARTSSSDNDNTRMVNRYTEMAECDLFTLLGGFNDSVAPFSDWNEKCGSVETKDDPTTIFGACCIIIEGYKAMYPYSNAIPVIMTYPFTDSDSKKQINQTLRDVASYYNAPLIDFEKECGFIYGFNVNITRDNIAEGHTWVDNKRIDIHNGINIWENTSASNGWSYIADYIPIASDMKWWGQSHLGSNVLCYDSNKNFIGYQEGRDNEFLEGTAFIRINTYTNVKESYSIQNIGGTFGDGAHPNIIGFKLRMAPVWAAKMNELLLPIIV